MPEAPGVYQDDRDEVVATQRSDEALIPIQQRRPLSAARSLPWIGGCRYGLSSNSYNSVE